MNIKPSGQQVEKWIAEASSEGGKILDPNKLAGLVAQWGASQAQQPTGEEPDNVRHVLLAAMRDIGAVLNGNYDEGHLEKTCTKIAAILYGGAPSRAFEPELPEAVARVVGCRIPDECNDQISTKLEPGTLLYTATHMHDYFQAGVRAGAAGIPWRTIDSAQKDGKCLVLVDTDDGVLKSAEVERANTLLRKAYAVIEEAVELIGSDECTAKETLAAIKQHLGEV